MKLGVYTCCIATIFLISCSEPRKKDQPLFENQNTKPQEVTVSNSDINLQLVVNEGSVPIGSKAKFWIHIKNDGQKIIELLNVKYRVPSGLVYESSYPEGQYNKNSNEVSWSLKTVLVSEKKQIEVEVRTQNLGFYNNPVEVAANYVLGGTARAQNSVDFSAREVAVEGNPDTYETDDPVQVNEETTYVVRLKNEDEEKYTNIQLKNRIPVQMELVTVISHPYKVEYQYNPEIKTLVFEPIEELWPGGVLTWKIICKAKEIGQGINRATISCDQITKAFVDEEKTDIVFD